MSVAESDGNGGPIEGIAVVGMAGRFPGAPDIGQFWSNLYELRESVRFFLQDELRMAGTRDAVINDPHYVPARAVLEDADLFDAEFFGFSPREAELMDPQFRQLLMCAWEACEHAGYPGGEGRRTGVYVGMGATSYLLHLLADASTRESLALLRALILNDRDYLSTLISYKLDLRGPSLTVQTACSSSLVAVHLACQSLQTGESDFALAGGVSISFPQEAGYRFEGDGFMSPDGHCRAFDSEGQGTVEGNGAGIVVLRRLEDALRDGDTIHAVIRGSAVNNDGAGRVGFTAPSVDGQARVLAEALSMAGVHRESVGFIETHGTGTPLGDPIEVAALARVYGKGRNHPCILGSVKTNIGHLGAAAGIGGLIKAILSVTNGIVPGTLHFEKPNPRADLDGSGFVVSPRSLPWPDIAGPRRAAVSSFGVGGTNAHVILEQAPPEPPSALPASPSFQVLPWSARTPEAFERATANLRGHIEGQLAGQAGSLGSDLGDVAYTLQVGRRPFGERGAMVCRDGAQAERLFREGSFLRGRAPEGAPQLVFLFAGLGDQYAGMGRDLYQRERVFRQTFDRCAEGFRAHLGIDLRERCFAGPAAGPANGVGPTLDLRRMIGRGGPQPDEQGLADPLVAQPAVFALEIALTETLASWGVRPDAVAGHSLGEYAAAQVAGILDLDGAIRMVAERARMVAALSPGGMLAVSLSEADLQRYLGDGLSLAAVNGDAACTVAGDSRSLEALQERLTGDGVLYRRLSITRAFHSWMMDAAKDEMATLAAAVPLSAPQIPCISNVTGQWMTAADAMSGAYWARHLRETVRFRESLSTLCAAKGDRVFVEIGPGRSLTSFLRQAIPDQSVTVGTVRHAYEIDDDQRHLLEAGARLWTAGVRVRWSALHDQPRRRVPLPSYPFARDRHRFVRSGVAAEPGFANVPAQVATAANGGQGDASGAVAAPSPPRSLRSRVYVGPTNDLERSIVDLWQQSLGVDAIGIHDDFFEFGGQSLLGLQVLAALRQRYDVELPLRVLFEANTPAKMALAIEDALLSQIEREEAVPASTGDGSSAPSAETTERSG